LLFRQEIRVEDRALAFSQRLVAGEHLKLHPLVIGHFLSSELPPLLFFPFLFFTPFFGCLLLLSPPLLRFKFEALRSREMALRLLLFPMLMDLNNQFRSLLSQN